MPEIRSYPCSSVAIFLNVLKTKGQACHPSSTTDRAGLSFFPRGRMKCWAREGKRERYTGFRSGEMNDEVQDLLNAGYKPVVVGPQPFSFEDLLRNVDPAPDQETERFVAAIYADRRQSAEDQSPE
jgi:hypothetical protein